MFREANSCPRAKLEGNCELRGTDNVHVQDTTIQLTQPLLSIRARPTKILYTKSQEQSTISWENMSVLFSQPGESPILFNPGGDKN